MPERIDPLADLFPMIPPKPRNQEPGTQQAWELELARMQDAARAEALASEGGEG